MKLKTLGFALSVAMTFTSVANATMYSELSEEARNQIDAGKLYAPEPMDVEGSAWPEVTVYQRVEATPMEAAAVMFDYPLHTKIFEGVTKSEPKFPGARSTEVAYRMTFPRIIGFPAIPDEIYTVLDVLDTFGNGGYQISWTKVAASSLKDTYGAAKFERIDHRYTLVSYTSLISPPKPALARIITKLAIGRVHDSVKALVKYIEGERGSQQLKDQVAQLKKALSIAEMEE